MKVETNVGCIEIDYEETEEWRKHNSNCYRYKITVSSCDLTDLSKVDTFALTAYSVSVISGVMKIAMQLKRYNIYAIL